MTGDLPISALPEDQRNRDLGWMLHDRNYMSDMAPRFFRAVLRDGVVEVPPPDSDEVKA